MSRVGPATDGAADGTAIARPGRGRRARPVPAGVVVISGASSGLGAEMARQFAGLGHDLGLCARRTGLLRTLAAELGPDRRVDIAALDVTDAAAVHEVFGGFAERFGTIDRIVVNAGVGLGAPVGTGRAEQNRTTVETNFVGALNQAEAALEIFRRQRFGHLVFISSISALRGMRRSMAAYSASKAGVAVLAEGLRAERIPGVRVSTIYPGYIASEMNAGATRRIPFIAATPVGVAAIVRAVERERTTAYVPTWPWLPVAVAMRVLPLSVVRRFG